MLVSVKGPPACPKAAGQHTKREKGLYKRTALKLSDLSVFSNRVTEETERKGGRDCGRGGGRGRCLCMSGLRPLFQKMRPGLGTS